VGAAGADPQPFDAARANGIRPQIIDLKHGVPQKVCAGCVSALLTDEALCAHSAGVVKRVDVPVTSRSVTAGTARRNGANIACIRAAVCIAALACTPHARGFL